MFTKNYEMVSLSKEWALLSKAMYGEDFIDELAEFLKKQRVKTILECGCGDSYIFNGLAKRGFKGVGVDSDSEMISLALRNYKHPNIEYKRMNWLNVRKLERQFDAVICRGNSLSYVISWKKEGFNSKQAKEKIKESVSLFFEMLRNNGLLYLDTISQTEIDKNGGDIYIDIGNIHAEGKIEYDRQNKVRRISGKRLGSRIITSSVSYLLEPNELEEMVRDYSPKKIFRPKFNHENNYKIICAIK